MNDSEILQYLIDNGKIDPSSVLKEMERKEFEIYLAMHTYKVWEGTNGKWYTYLPTEDGRSLKKRNSEEDINQLIVDYYKAQDEEPTVSSVFKDWIATKLEYGEIGKGTYDRYSNDFNRFIGGTDFESMRVKAITPDALEDFVRLSIREHKLTRKGFANLRTLLIGVFKRAKKTKCTEISISWFFKDLELSNNIFTKSVKKKEEQVFMEGEITAVVDYLRANPTIFNLGLLLAFQTGLRTAELVALKSTDILGRAIHVQRQEIRYKDGDTNKTVRVIKDYPKTDKGNRYVIITDSALETINLIKQLNPTGEFLLANNGKKINVDSFNKPLYAVCNALAIPRRSMHKIRRTYGTTLIDEGVTESVIMEQMGHADISTTRSFYYYSNKAQKTKEAQIANAITI